MDPVRGCPPGASRGTRVAARTPPRLAGATERVADLELAATALERLGAAEVSRRRPKGLTTEAWRVADRLGWTKTYDAEYVALARLLRCRLLTTDAKMKASASGLVEIIGPADL